MSIITPPRITESIIDQVGSIDIKNIWLQPGAESEKAVARAKELGMNVIYGGPCILVEFSHRGR